VPRINRAVIGPAKNVCVHSSKVIVKLLTHQIVMLWGLKF